MITASKAGLNDSDTIIIGQVASKILEIERRPLDEITCQRAAGKYDKTTECQYAEQSSVEVVAIASTCSAENAVLLT
jgi:hypothetical protein